MVYCASKNRRYPLWPIDGAPTCSPAPRSSWISPVCPSRSFRSWSRPSRWRFTRRWRLALRGDTADALPVCHGQTLPSADTGRPTFFLPTSRKTYSLQVVQGRLLGMGQSKANQWMHVLLPALQAALRTLGATPARSLTALAQQLGVSEAAAASMVVPLEEAPAPVATKPAGIPASPLVPMTGRHGASSAPKTLLNRRRVRAARKRITRSKMSCASIPPSPSSF